MDKIHFEAIRREKVFLLISQPTCAGLVCNEIYLLVAFPSNVFYFSRKAKKLLVGQYVTQNIKIPNIRRYSVPIENLGLYGQLLAKILQIAI